MGLILERMVKEARSANGGRQLPYPQDIKLRMNAGDTCRVSLAFWESQEDGLPDFDQTPRFVGCDRHYIPPDHDTVSGSGGYVLCQQKEGSCPWCALRDETAKVSRKAFATLVVVWPTDKHGKLDLQAFKRQECDVMPWVMSGSLLQGLRFTDKEFSLSNIDLLLSCDNAQYQRISSTPAKDNLYRKLLDKGQEPIDPENPLVHSRVQGWLSSIIQRTNAMVPMLREVLAAPDLVSTEAEVAAKISFLGPVAR
jgi:hypothetical protein